MKKALIYLLLFFTSLPSWGQVANPAKSLLAEEYLNKSKRQKKAAWMLLGGGAAVLGAAVLIGTTNKEMSFDNAVTVGLIGTAGAVSSIVSIPFFVASGRNKRKSIAASASLGILKQSVKTQGESRTGSLTAFSVKIAF